MTKNNLNKEEKKLIGKIRYLEKKKSNKNQFGEYKYITDKICNLCGDVINIKRGKPTIQKKFFCSTNCLFAYRFLEKGAIKMLEKHLGNITEISIITKKKVFKFKKCQSNQQRIKRN